jgi:mRNA interferase YafQ
MTAGSERLHLKRAKKRGKDMEKIKVPMQLLIEEKPLPGLYGDHSLASNWKGCRDLHIEPDWLFIPATHGFSAAMYASRTR